jgi:rubrerythrin
MALTSIKKQLEQTLATEQVLLQFYRELGERLGNNDIGQACKTAAAAAQERVAQLSAWLDCRN